MAGAFLDQLDGEVLQTMAVTTTRQAADAYVAGDPFVAAGKVTEYHIRPGGTSSQHRPGDQPAVHRDPLAWAPCRSLNWPLRLEPPRPTSTGEVMDPVQQLPDELPPGGRSPSLADSLAPNLAEAVACAAWPAAESRNRRGR